MSALSRVLADARAKRGWTKPELARALGATTPREVHRMTMKLAAIEQGSDENRKLLRRAVAVLGGDCEALERTITVINEAAAARFREWLSEEVPSVVHYRLAPSFWFTEEFAPSEREKAYAFAAWIARERWLYVTLEPSRRLMLWFEAGTGKESQREEWVDGAGWTRTLLIGKAWRDASAFRDGIFPGGIRCARCDGSPIEGISREDAWR